VACEVRRTERPGHAAELAAAWAAAALGAGGAAAGGAPAGAPALFVVGGDGTAMEVVGALAGTGLPAGSSRAAPATSSPGC
jgi:diacylglycerol kinase family enzyme